MVLGRLLRHRFQAILRELFFSTLNFVYAKCTRVSFFFPILFLTLTACSVPESIQGYLGSTTNSNVTITSPTIAEGSSGQIDITLAKALSVDAVVTYTSANATATAAADFTAVTGTLTITAGQTVASIPVTTLDDPTYEGTETFDVTFTVPSTLKLSGTTKTVTITDDEIKPTVQFAVATDTVSENVMLGTKTITVNLVGALTERDVVVNYDYVTGMGAGTADPLGVDYTLFGGSLTIAAGTSSETFDVTITNDTVYEGNENLILELTSPNANASLGAITQEDLTITDNETPPTINFQYANINASESITSNNINVTLSGTAQSPVTVHYAVTGGTATGGGTDYTLAAGDLTFASLDASENIALTINDDAIPELSETIVVTLSAPTIAVLGTTTVHTYTIEDDDATGVAWIGGTGNHLFSDPLNWSTNTIPGPTDIALFNNACSGLNCNVTIDQIVNVAGIHLASGYTGIVTQGAFDITVGTADFKVDAGTFNGSTNLITLNKNFTQTGGIFNAGAQSLVSTGGFTRSAGTLNMGSSTLEFAGWGIDTSINVSGATLNHLLFNKSSCSYHTTSGIVNVSGNWTNNSNGCAYMTGTGTYQVSGNVTVNGGTTDSATPMTIRLVGSSPQVLSGAGGSIGNLEFASTNNITINGAVSFSGNLTYTSGTLAGGTGTLATALGHDQTIAMSGQTIPNFKFTKISTNWVTVTGLLKVSGNYYHSCEFGANNLINGGTVEVSGDIITTWGGAGYSCGGGTATLKLVGAGNHTITGVQVAALPNLEFDTTGTVTLLGDVWLGDGFTYTNAGSVITAGSNLKQVTRGQNTTISPGPIVFNNVEIEHYGYGSHSIIGTWIVGGNFKLSHNSYSSTLSVSGGTIEARGDVTFDDANTSFSSALSLTGGNTQTVRLNSGSFTSGTVTVNKSGGVVNSGTALNLNGSGQDLNIVNGMWDLSGYALTVNDQLNVGDGVGAASSAALNQGCASVSAASSNVNPTDGVINAGSASPNITISGDTKTEGANLTFTVQLDAPKCGSAITVDYATQDGTALYKADYTKTTGTLTIPAAQTSATFTIATVNDLEDEPAETMSILLSNAVGGTISSGTATGTINDNDAASNYIWTGNAFPDTNWTTGGNWSGGSPPPNNHTAIFDGTCVHCDATINANIDIDGLRMRADYTGTITQAGANTITFHGENIHIQGGTFVGGTGDIIGLFNVQDTRFAGGTITATSGTWSFDEALVIDNANATFNHNNGTINITGDCGCSTGDDEVRGNFTFYNFSDTRSNGEIKLTGNTLTVLHNFLLDTTSPLGHIYGQGTIDVKGDVNINQASPYITNNPVLKLSGTGDQYYTQNIGNWAHPPANVVMDKPSGNVIQTTDVLFDGNTYAGNLHFINGTWKMAGHNLTLQDADDSFTLDAGTTLNKGCGVLTTNGPFVNNGTIIDGGVATPNISIADSAAQAEGNAGTKTFPFVISLDAPRCSGNVVVQYDTANGFASSGSDYTAITAQTLTFAVGETSKTINVTTNGDSTVEGDETFNIVLSNPVNGVIVDGTGTGTINNDDSSGFTWTGAAGNNLWNAAGNWAGGVVPGASDTALLVPYACTGANCDISLNTAVSVRSIQMLNGYSGIVTQGANPISIDWGKWIIQSGTFMGSTSPISLFSDIDISGGTFTAGAQTISLYLGWKSSGGTVNLAGSTVDFTGNLATAAIDSGSVVFDKVDFTKTDYWDIFVTGVMRVDGNLTFNNQATFENTFNGGTIEVSGNVTVTELQGGNGVVKLVGSGTQNISVAAGQLLPSLEIASSGTVNFGGYVAISDNFKYTSGTVNTTGSTFEINGIFNTSSVDSGSMVFNNVLVAKQDTYDLYVTGVMKVGGDLTFNSAPGFNNTFDIGTIEASGNVTVTEL